MSGSSGPGVGEWSGARSRSGRGSRLLLRVGGSLLAAGTTILLAVGGWVLVGDWWAARSAADGVARLDRAWDAPSGPARPAPPGDPDVVAGGRTGTSGGTAAPTPDSAFAVMRVPRLGAQWAQPVIEGIAAQDLRRGVGHYPGTALPGGPGNFAVAGHRTTWGHPFGDIDRLVAGDRIMVETAAGWFTYRVTGHQIVSPDDGAVLAAGPGATITLTACHPRWSAALRWVVHGVLVAIRPRVPSAGPPVAALF